MKEFYQIGSALDVGQKRRGSPNQDLIGCALPGRFNRRPPLLVLSDGMGGYSGGEIASRLAVSTLVKIYKKTSIRKPDFQKILVNGIKAAHQEIIKKGKSNKKLQALGCTIVAAILTEDQIHLANVGDSRAYLIRGENIQQISHDHSKVADMVRAGLLTEIEARNHPKKNELSLSLTARRETAPPYLINVEWIVGDIVLLCSDGLWGPVTESQILAAVSEMEPQEAADKLVKLANTNRGPDNISVIIAKNIGNVKDIDQSMVETGEFNVKSH